MEAKNVFHKIEENFIKASQIIAITLLALMVIIVFSNVISRYFLNASLAWSEEISRIMIVWLVLLGSVLAYVNDEHLGLDILVKAVPKRVASFIYIIADILVLYAIYLFTKGGYGLAMQSWDWLTPATGIPYAIVYMSVPICGGIMFIQTILKFVRTIKNFVANK